MDKILLPREKALNYGISSLEDKELLALILKTGYKDKDVFMLIDELIDKANGFENLLSINYEELISIKGIKEAKALEILAILEISKRLSKLKRIDLNVMSSSTKIVDWIRFNIGFSLQEEFLVIYLNNGGYIIKHEILFKGSEKSSNISINEIIRRAILLRSNYLVIAHNHPGGKAFPSNEDIVITNKIKEGLNMMDIKLLDHLIITKYDFYSFNENGLL